MKKLLSVILSMVLLITALPVTTMRINAVEAEQSSEYSGECGTDALWSINPATGVMTITGTGATQNYGLFTSTPWFNVSDTIKSVEIDERITSVGTYSFNGCTNLVAVATDNKDLAIGKYALNSANSITVYGNAGGTLETYCQENGFTFASHLTKPNVTEITPDTITVEQNSEWQYSLDKEMWQSSNVFSLLNECTEYTVYIRRKTGLTPMATRASEGTVVTTLPYPTPERPVLSSVTADTITIVKVDGLEYSLDKVEWNSTGIFTGLKCLSEYNVYARPITSIAAAQKISEPLAVSTPDYPIPGTPTLKNVTDTSIIVNVVDGYEYSLDKEEWTTAGVFTDLSPAKVYSVYVRLVTTIPEAQKVSEALVVTTLKSTVLAPSAPVIESYAGGKVVLQHTEGYEYSNDGKTWQTSNEFDGIEYDVLYTFYQRVAETDTEYASDSSAVVKIIIPSAPAIEFVGATMISVEGTEGYEYTLDKVYWQTSVDFKDLIEDFEYTVYCRPVAQSDLHQVISEGTNVTINGIKDRHETPVAPTVLERTETSVTLTPIEGYEYKIDGGEWQSSNVFTDLSSISEFKFYQRVATDDNLYASHGSLPIVVETYYTLIYTKEQLNDIRNDLSGKYVLTEDIVFTETDFAEGGDFYNDGKGWTPIGTASAPFTGIFDGNGHTIKGLKINIKSETEIYAGLFGYVKGGTIKNLGMLDSDIKATSSADEAYVGGIVGYARDVIRGTVIRDCYNTGSVTATGQSVVYAGGIAGYGSIISNCYNTGSVIATGQSSAYAGGIAGYVGSSTIRNCYNTGSVTATSTSLYASMMGHACAGGIAGCSFHLISNSYNTGSVIAEGRSGVYAHAGGIAGYVDRYSETIRNCYNTGSVIAKGISVDEAYAGGIAGYSFHVIINCYNTGSVIAEGRSVAYAGGIAGEIVNHSVIRYCYNTGSVAATARSSNLAGGIAGYVYSGTIINCYYLDNIDEGVGYGIADTAVKCTDEQMKQQATFEGFDFDTVWTMEGNMDYPLPELQDVELKYERIIESIEVKTVPNKTVYLEAKDMLDLTGGKLTVKTDLFDDIIDLTPEMITGFDNTKVGKQTLTVTHEGYTTTFDIEIIAKELTSIKVTKVPTKATYLEAKDILDVTGGKVTLYYNNDTSEEIALTASMITGFDNKEIGKQTLTVTYGGKTTTFDIKIVAKSVTLMELIASPTKTEYLEGKDTLDVTDGKIKVYYNNGTSEEIDLTLGMVSGFNNKIVGEQMLTVTYGGKTDTFDIEIIAKSLSCVAVTTKPTKIEYLEAKDMLDISGGKLTLYYNNDTSEEISLTNGMVKGFDNTVVGKQTLTVTYEGKTTTFDIKIVAKSVTLMELIASPTKTEYLEGKDTLDVTDGKIKVYYNNDKNEEIDLTPEMVTGFDNTEVGKQTLTVTYGGKTDTYEVEIIAKSLSSISVYTLPTNLVFTQLEDDLDITGGKVKLHYNNDTFDIIDMTSQMVTGFNNSVVGSQTLTVTYLSKTTTYDIEIEPPYILGDTNGNDTVDSDDAIYLLKHTLFPESFELKQKSDFDGNGEVNSDDAIYLLKHTLFPESFPLHKS